MTWALKRHSTCSLLAWRPVSSTDGSPCLGNVHSTHSVLTRAQHLEHSTQDFRPAKPSSVSARKMSLASKCMQINMRSRVRTSVEATTFSSARRSPQLKSKVGNILAKAAALRITLNIDGAPVVSRSHTHPSHSPTSRLLTSSMSLGVTVPRGTQYMRGV